MNFDTAVQRIHSDPGARRLAAPEELSADDARLMELAKEFEAIMTAQIMKEGMKNASVRWDSEPGAPDSHNQYMEIAFERLAYFVGRQGMLGLHQMLYESMKQQAARS